MAWIKNRINADRNLDWSLLAEKKILNTIHYIFEEWWKTKRIPNKFLPIGLKDIRELRQKITGAEVSGNKK